MKKIPRACDVSSIDVSIHDLIRNASYEGKIRGATARVWTVTEGVDLVAENEYSGSEFYIPLDSQDLIPVVFVEDGAWVMWRNGSGGEAPVLGTLIVRGGKDLDLSISEVLNSIDSELFDQSEILPKIQSKIACRGETPPNEVLNILHRFGLELPLPGPIHV